MKTPRTLLADYLRTKLPARKYLLLDAPEGITQLEAGRPGVVLAPARITPAPNRSGVRVYETDVWAVSTHADVLRAIVELELLVERLLQLIDQAPFEAVWESAEYDQFGDSLFHAYRITIRTPLEVTYS